MTMQILLRDSIRQISQSNEQKNVALTTKTQKSGPLLCALSRLLLILLRFGGGGGALPIRKEKKRGEKLPNGIRSRWWKAGVVNGHPSSTTKYYSLTKNWALASALNVIFFAWLLCSGDSIRRWEIGVLPVCAFYTWIFGSKVSWTLLLFIGQGLFYFVLKKSPK